MGKQKGLDDEQTYLNSKTVRQFTHYINDTMSEGIPQDVRSAPFFVNIMDGVADSARVEQERINVYYCKLGVIIIKFLAIESVEKADAATIFDAVVSGFQKSAGIDEPTLYNKFGSFCKCLYSYFYKTKICDYVDLKIKFDKRKKPSHIVLLRDFPEKETHSRQKESYSQ